MKFSVELSVILVYKGLHFSEMQHCITYQNNRVLNCTTVKA
jgi:hypothetical protein